jgi:hypothetical protein
MAHRNTWTAAELAKLKACDGMSPSEINREIPTHTNNSIRAKLKELGIWKPYQGKGNAKFLRSLQKKKRNCPVCLLFCHISFASSIACVARVTCGLDYCSYYLIVQKMLSDSLLKGKGIESDEEESDEDEDGVAFMSATAADKHEVPFIWSEIFPDQKFYVMVLKQSGVDYKFEWIGEQEIHVVARGNISKDHLAQIGKAADIPSKFIGHIFKDAREYVTVLRPAQPVERKIEKLSEDTDAVAVCAFVLKEDIVEMKV